MVRCGIVNSVNLTFFVVKIVFLEDSFELRDFLTVFFLKYELSPFFSLQILIVISINGIFRIGK